MTHPAPPESPAISQGLLLNVGCGTFTAPGWVNIDQSANAWLAKHAMLRGVLARLRLLPKSSVSVQYDRHIRIRDIHRRGLGIPDESAAWIYNSQLMNMMSREQGVRFAAECWRALRPGGRLRIVVPDLSTVAAEWKTKIDAYLGHDRAYFHSTGFERRCVGDEFVDAFGFEGAKLAGLSRLQRLQYYPIQRHYDFESLSVVLSEGGFTTIVKSGYRQDDMPDVETLDVHETSLHVEAEKQGLRR